MAWCSIKAQEQFHSALLNELYEATVGWSCREDGEKRDAYRIFVRNPVENEQL
jgi:hypothetical protein